MLWQFAGDTTSPVQAIGEICTKIKRHMSILIRGVTWEVKATSLKVQHVLGQLGADLWQIQVPFWLGCKMTPNLWPTRANLGHPGGPPVAILGPTWGLSLPPWANMGSTWRQLEANAGVILARVQNDTQLGTH